MTSRRFRSTPHVITPPRRGERILSECEGAVLAPTSPHGYPDVRIAAATMLRTADGWRAAPWWPGFYGRGLMPVALDRSNVVEFAASVAERGFLGRRWRTVAWYWRVIEETPRTLRIYGPFETPEEALRL